jgi:DNA-binding MarR family transcriptional regulator
MHQNGLEKLVGLQIGITYSLMTTQLQKMLEPCKLTPKEAVVLWLSAENPGVTQSDIAAFLGVNRATILHVTQSLKAAHLVDLEGNPSDRRKLGLHVTSAGTAALVQARTIIDEQETSIRSKIAPDTCDLVIASMQRLR